MVFLCDANARMGSVQSCFVGGFAAEEENENGEEFHRIIAEFGIFLPNTFRQT